MKIKFQAILVFAALILAQMACNLPSMVRSQETQLPAPDQTLTALFAVTPIATQVSGRPATETATLPPIFTPTIEESGESGGGIAPTSTQPAPSSTNTSAPTAIPTVGITPLATQAQPAATSVPVRRSVFNAQYLSTPPTIDGDWGEWKDETTEYPANYVTYGSGNWTGENDLSSSFHIGWDNNYLYVAVKVRDDTFVQNASGANLYQGDSIEILLDTKLQEDFYYSQLSPDDFQLGISPGKLNSGGAGEAYLWFPSNVTGKRSNVTIAARQESGVYRLEAAIPWNVFEISPSNGARYGFVLSASDNDNPSDNVQQSMVSSTPNRHLTDPTTWGELRLVK